MGKRKGWDELSQKYRNRLERNGVSKASYENGSSIAKARGHASTPERPSDAYSVTGRRKYRAYLERAGTLRKKVIDRKVQLFGNRFKYNEERSRQYVMQGGAEVAKPGIVELRGMLDKTDDEIEETLHDPNIDDQWKFLWYH